MRQLIIKNFSCIENAALTFSRITVIIGPQASGKSVICKLSYFFIDILRDQTKFISSGDSIEVYKDFITKKFLEWFPPSAWGSKKFTIDFFAGNYRVSLARKIYRAKVSDGFRIKFSTEFETHYAEARAQVLKTKAKSSLSFDYEREWKVQEIVQKSSNALLGKDYLNSQIFIPAGRSFFTSIGKAVAAFEQGRVLDPLILRFGRIFTSYKDESRYLMREAEKLGIPPLQKSFASILGGTLIVSGDQEFVECADGRKIPLSALSSGQQELLPLVAVLPYLMLHKNRQAVFIEEPEAHLFPSAQSSLVELLTSLVTSASNGLELVLTTHSPYVLVKINNLIKAGQLGRSHSEVRRLKVQSVVPRSSWLGHKFVAAYAIKDGCLENIIDHDGLIAADYLDEVSGNISAEFMKLLEIEVSE